MSSDNVRHALNLLHGWSKDQRTVALSTGEVKVYTACVTAQQATRMEGIATEQGVNVDAMEL